MQRRSRRSGGFNIDRPTVSLPVSDTETGRLRFQLSSLIFHAFTAREGGGGGGKGSRCSLLFAVSSMERLFPSFVLGPQVFLPRAKGKQKTNYKDGHHVTLPTWLYIYIQATPALYHGRKFLAGPTTFSPRYFLPSKSFLPREFREQPRSSSQWSQVRRFTSIFG